MRGNRGSSFQGQKYHIKMRIPFNPQEGIGRFISYFAQTSENLDHSRGPERGAGLDEKGASNLQEFFLISHNATCQ